LMSQFQDVAATGTYSGGITMPTSAEAVGIISTWATAAAPANTVAPAVTGTAQVGQTLSCSAGTWTDSGSPTFTFQWQDSADGLTSWANVASATTSSYTVAVGELSKYLRCVVTDTDGVGATAANSNVVGPVAAAPAVSGPPIATDSAQTAHDKLIALGYSEDEATRLKNQWTHES
jgi:hypothetical protein